MKTLKTLATILAAALMCVAVCVVATALGITGADVVALAAAPKHIRS